MQSRPSSFFPESGRQALIGHTPSSAFLDALRIRQIDVVAGECVVEAHASMAGINPRGHSRTGTAARDRLQPATAHDMPVSDAHAFVFTQDGHAGMRAGSLKDLYVRAIETRANGKGLRDVANDISQAVRARYEMKSES